jgi:hypothetical protein
MLIELAAKKKTSKRNCVKGYPCGASCISKTKTCRKALKGQGKTASKKVKKTAAKPPSNTEVLRNALAAGDYDTAATAAELIYQDAQNLAPGYVEFLDGIMPGNRKTEDWILKAMYKDAGYDGKPKKVSAKTIDSHYKNGQYVAYRAVGSSDARFKMHFDNFKNGDYFAGHGIYGHGTYVAHAVQGGTHSRQTASTSASPYGKGLMRLSLSRSANVVRQSDHEYEVKRIDSEMKAWARQQKSQAPYRRLREVVLGDSIGQKKTSGRLAVLQRVDAIQLDNAYDPTYMNLLNRSVVSIQNTPGTLYAE